MIINLLGPEVESFLELLDSYIDKYAKKGMFDL